MKNGCITDTWGREWYLNDKLHREDGPAKEYTNGFREWYLNGNRHREDGPAVEHANGTRVWYFNGKLHREDGPAVERADGSRSWCLNDMYHREDGPAIEHADGSRSWWVQGVQVRNVKSLKNFRERLKEAEKYISLKAYFEKENAERDEKHNQSMKMRSKKIKLENMKKKFVEFMKNMVKEGEFTEEELLEIYRLAMMECVMTT
jgi:hypothetical protein